MPTLVTAISTRAGLMNKCYTLVTPTSGATPITPYPYPYRISSARIASRATFSVSPTEPRSLSTNRFASLPTHLHYTDPYPITKSLNYLDVTQQLSTHKLSISSLSYKNQMALLFSLGIGWHENCC